MDLTDRCVGPAEGLGAPFNVDAPRVAVRLLEAGGVDGRQCVLQSRDAERVGGLGEGQRTTVNNKEKYEGEKGEKQAELEKR